MKPRLDKKINFYHRIILAIQATNRLPSDLTPQRARYYTKPLVDSKLIEYKGSGATGAWFLTETFKRLERQGMIKKSNLMALVKPSVCTKVKNVRGHGFGMRLKVPKLAGWNDRFEVMKAHGYKPVKLKTGAIQVILGGNKTHLCNSSIVMHYDSDYSYVASSAIESLARATKDFLKHIGTLESKFDIRFKINGKYRYKCFKHHFGHLDNVIAKKCKLEGKTYTIYREDGKPWLEIDFSNRRFVEGETINPVTGAFDMDTKIKPLFDEVDRNPHFLRDTRQEITTTKKELTSLKEENAELRDIVKSNAYMMRKLMDLHEYNTKDINYIKEKLHK